MIADRKSDNIFLEPLSGNESEYFSLGTNFFRLPLLGEQGKFGLRISHLDDSTISIFL